MNRAKIKYIIPIFVVLFSCRTVNLATLIGTTNFDQVKEEIQNGADVNITLQNSLTSALHVASRYGYYTIAKSLLEKGAHVNVLDEKKNTPLHLATSKCNVRLIELLIQHGANVNAVNKFKQSPWDLACGPLATKLLLGAGAK